MRRNKLHTVFVVSALSVCSLASGQLVIDHAQFFIQPGATVTVQGDVTSNADILGTGTLQMKGTSPQNLNMGGFTVPNLEIDNTSNVILTSEAKVGASLLFTNGKIQLGNFNFILATAASVTGAGDNKFLETNGTGFAQRNIGNAAASNQQLPVGVGTKYAPISLSHSGGVYTAGLLGAQAKSGKSPNSHIRAESYTNLYWPVATSGIIGGTFNGTGTYPADASAGFTGTETDIRGMSFNGTVWSLTGEGHDYAANTVSAQLSANGGQIFGMNRFVLMNSKVLLQGAKPVAGVMVDGLRSGTNVIPATEPYRGAPYNFASVNGGVQEVASAAVFSDLGTLNNIVDWVFLELRTGVSSGSTLLQTRSAFLQRDGDVVDIDGLSPLYFKNVDAGDYTITVRHRNHMAISTNNTAGYYKNLTLSSSTPALDLTSPVTNILGGANVNYAQVGGYNMMLSGNSNFNTNVKYAGPANDKTYLLTNVLAGNELSILSSSYSQGDLNMDKIVRYAGPTNDKTFLLVTPLSSNEINIFNQVLPN